MRIVPRSEWCSIRARGTPTRMALPSPELYLHHGAAGTSSLRTAIGYVRYHIEQRGWRDVGYQFLIAEGKVLEGRGAGVIGAHVQGRNSVSQGVCMVGEYTSHPPSDEDLDALRWLLAHGAEQGWWPTAQLTGGHRDAPGASTACPGDALYALVPQINGSPAGDIVRTLRLTFPRLRGNDVKEWQTLIGVTADGIFGPDTDAATRVMQADLGVKVDGIVGPKTRAAATPAPVSAPVSKTEPVGDVDQDTIRRIIREEIDAALGGRNVGTDLRRIRISQRAIGIAVGAPVDHQGPDDGTTVIA